MAALRGSRRLAQILLRIKIELLFAFGAAEVILLPFVLGPSSGGSCFYVHAAHKIFHCCCVLHYHVPFVHELCLDGSTNVSGFVKLPSKDPFRFLRRCSQPKPRMKRETPRRRQKTMHSISRNMLEKVMSGVCLFSHTFADTSMLGWAGL